MVFGCEEIRHGYVWLCDVYLHTYHNLHVKTVVSGRVGRVFVAQIRDVARRDSVHGDVLQIPSVRSGHRSRARGKRRRRGSRQTWRGCVLAVARGRNVTRTNDADLPHGCIRPDVVLRKCAQTWRCRITTVRVSDNGARVTFISGAVFGLGSALRSRSEQFSLNNMCITSKCAYGMSSSNSRKLGVNASLVVALRWLPRGPP